MNGPESADNQTTPRRRSSRPAASCRRASSRSSRAGRRHGGTSRAARSTRTRVSSTSTARSPTCPTSGSPGRWTVPADGGSLDFWTSVDTEADWDYVFVEARTPGGDDWTTLPDINGHTTQTTGESCALRVARAAPAARPLPDARPATGTCTSTGTTGTWNASSGNSAGWQEWSVDLVGVRRAVGRGLDHLRQ